MKEVYGRFYEGMVSWRKKVASTTHWQWYFDWQLHINQNWRNATLIAVSGSDFLFEYEMPNEKYYYHQVSINDKGEFSAIGKSVNRRKLPNKWKLADWYSESHFQLDERGQLCLV